MSEKVLLVDTNFSSQPIADYLIQAGYKLYIVGNKVHDALTDMPDLVYINLDYSDIKNLKNIVIEYGIDFIVPGCTDLSYKVCSKLKELFPERFGLLDSVANEAKINRKDEFKELTEILNIKAPQRFFNDYKFPVIVKPVDSFSGRGVSIANDDLELKSAIKHAISNSMVGNYTVEEYIEGDLYSYSCFLESDLVIESFIVKEDSSYDGFSVDVSFLVENFPLHLKEILKEYIERISQHLSLNNGLIHAQFLLKNDEIYIIEITRRCPGDLYSQLIEMQTGCNYIENYIRPFLGLKLDLNHKGPGSDFFVRHTVLLNSRNNYKGISFNKTALIYKWIPLAVSGDVVKLDDFLRVAVFFIKARSYEEQQEIYLGLLNRDFYHFI